MDSDWYVRGEEPTEAEAQQMAQNQQQKPRRFVEGEEVYVRVRGRFLAGMVVSVNVDRDGKLFPYLIRPHGTSEEILSGDGTAQAPYCFLSASHCHDLSARHFHSSSTR